MEPNNDPQLRALLKEWRAPETPASLERRVLKQRVLEEHDSWWHFLLRGYIRVPVPVVCGVVVMMGFGVWESARLAGKVESCLAVRSEMPAHTESVSIVCPVGSKC
jgi:hypothetical protein